MSVDVGADLKVRSQFPFWDFFCCNQVQVLLGEGEVARWCLNSLFGISFVVTFHPQGNRHCRGRGIRESQFPFWDFFCCNMDFFEAAKTSIDLLVSIPFLGFLLL